MQGVGCPHCGSVVTNDGTLSGQVVACPQCSGQFQMPVMAPPAQRSVQPLGSSRLPSQRKQQAGSPSLFNQVVDQFQQAIDYAHTQTATPSSNRSRMPSSTIPFVAGAVIVVSALFLLAGYVLVSDDRKEDASQQQATEPAPQTTKPLPKLLTLDEAAARFIRAAQNGTPEESLWANKLVAIVSRNDHQLSFDMIEMQTPFSKPETWRAYFDWKSTAAREAGYHLGTQEYEHKIKRELYLADSASTADEIIKVDGVRLRTLSEFGAKNITRPPHTDHTRFAVLRTAAKEERKSKNSDFGVLMAFDELPPPVLRSIEHGDDVWLLTDREGTEAEDHFELLYVVVSATRVAEVCEVRHTAAGASVELGKVGAGHFPFNCWTAFPTDKNLSDRGELLWTGSSLTDGSVSLTFRFSGPGKKLWSTKQTTISDSSWSEKNDGELITPNGKTFKSPSKVTKGRVFRLAK